MKTERTMTELIAAIRGGDQDAFTELYEQTSQEVYRTARAVLRDEDAALDVQQDTFVYAYQHLDQLGEPEKVRPWLRTIAVNRAKTLLRRNTPVLFTELENDEGEGLPEQADLSADASPELSLERKETAELVNEILSGLSDGQRAAVAMYYYEQMSASEIAEALGVNVSTVRNQLFRGRKKIEEAVRALEKKGVKLYGLSPVGFLVALMKKQTASAQAGQAVLAKTLAKAGLAAGAKTAAAGAGAAAVPVAETVVLQATRPFFTTVVGKVVLGVLCAGVIGGGIAGYNWAKDKLAPKTNPILYVDSAENLAKDPTTPTIPMQVDVQETTAPTVTEALATVASGEDLHVSEPAPETTAPAETKPERKEDQCGENLTWSIEKDIISWSSTYLGWNNTCLVIKGSGAMFDYDEENPAPWYDRRDDIDLILLPDGLTSIGSYAFCDLTNLEAPDPYLGYFNRINIPDGVTSIGSGAFQNTNVGNLVLPESVSSVADSAFSDSGLRELWVMNQDCVIGANQGISPELTVCGFSGSTAEQFAAQNGCGFNPMLPDRDAVTAQLRTSDPAGTRVVWLAKTGAGYMAKVVVFDPAFITEEALQQARQTGTVVLNGEEYPYTESREQAEKWNWVREDSEEEEGWSGWIYVSQGLRSGVYSVLRDGDRYVFYINSLTGVDDSLLRQTEPRDFAWFLLDDDTLVNSFNNRFGEYLLQLEERAKEFNRTITFPGDMFYYHNLYLTNDGEIMVEVEKSGAKR